MRNSLERAQADSFGHLLFTAARRLDEEAQALVNQQAGERLARPAIMRLLPFLDRVGIRPTELARRVDISKQAVGQSLAELERRGFVEYVDDPLDGRARLVRLSKAGVSASQKGLRVLAALEQRLTARVGPRAMATTMLALRSIIAELDAMNSED